MKLFKKPVATAGYKNKQTVSRRRYLARVLSSLMYRYALRQSASVSRFLYPAKGLRGFDSISLLTFNLHRYDNAAVIGVHAADAAGVHDQAIFELYLIRKKLFDGLGAARCITMGDHQCAVFGVSDFL